MNLKDIGEFGLIRRFAPDFMDNLPDEVVGIGDDCAVFPAGDEYFMVTTDLLVENIHFLKDGISAKALGHKSLAVNLSDIAAMGGKPMMSFLSLAFPKDIQVEWIDDFFTGYRELSEITGTWLMGGDTTKSPDNIVINVAVIGKANKNQIKYRSTAKAGDVICITGMTGESGAGLDGILNKTNVSAYLLDKHNLPNPHIEEGLFLGKKSSVHAMMDISDGIDSDLRHILKASGISGEIDLESVPISQELSDYCENRHLNASVLALTAGEDYSLLLTMNADDYENVNKEFVGQFHRPLHKIGQITAGNGELVYKKNGKIVQLKEKGFDHFG